nr:WecB/TagA/CpsF family glycosyltransferase [Oxynema sp. CENA135]
MVATIPPKTEETIFLPKTKVVNSWITALRFNEQMDTLIRWAKTRQSRMVCVANVHMLMEAYWNPEFARVLESADLVTPDGMPLVWMMRQQGLRQQDRVAGMEILLRLCDLAPRKKVSVFFLGSDEQTLAAMRQRLEQEFPDLDIAAMEPLPFRPLTPSEDRALIEKINRSGAGLVFLSLGCPKQELWMAQHQGQINAVTIGLGGVFPVYAGQKKWAPRWVRENGLEWLYRFVQEPTRLWGRYSKTIPPFVWLALKQLLTDNPVKNARYARELTRAIQNRKGNQPIGQLLVEAGLLTPRQVERILQEQRERNRDRRFGELLSEYGWVKPETIDFFAEQLPQLKNQPEKYPIGYYLKSAALLDDDQIEAIVKHQKKTGLRFGELAVVKGWIKQETVDLVLEHIENSQNSNPTLSMA